MVSGGIGALDFIFPTASESSRSAVLQSDTTTSDGADQPRDPHKDRGA